MLYKIVINYVRLILLRKLLNVFLAKGATVKGKGKGVKTMSLLTYALEFAATYLMKKGKRGK
ncbi:MAG: hypothetical protein H0U73_06220 [Tatlockia sp.]|nr:hypothetical protein [Tatlockia sp.]